MHLFIKQSKLTYLMAAAFLMGACSSEVTSPVEQIHQAQKLKESVKTVSKQTEMIPDVMVYHCNNDKKVEVERYKKATSAKKETIAVTFEGTLHQLSSTVTKDGKKYTNIRWTWHEPRNGKAFLYNNTKKTLAENCVKQP